MSKTKVTSNIKSKPKTKPKPPTTQKRTGNVYWADNRKIDPTDLKERRQYAVVRESKGNVKVAKIRGFNDNEKNNKRLYELDQKKYPLSKKSGVDKKVYYQRADNKKPLKLEDKQVFDKTPSFKLNSKDTHNVMVHTGMTSNRKRRNKA